MPELIITFIESVVFACEPTAGLCEITTPFLIALSCVTKEIFVNPNFSRNALAPLWVRPDTSGTVNVSITVVVGPAET